MLNDFSHVFQELLQEHPGVFYIDSSIRFTAPYNDEHYHQARRMGGFLFNHFGKRSSSTFTETHPDIYDYLPSNTTSLQTMINKAAGVILVYRTEKICRDVILPWVMCLLNEGCAQPMGIIYQNCKVTQRDVFSCHRFDQAVINLLIHNSLGCKPDNSWPLCASPSVVEVHRHGKGDVNPDKPNICAP